MSIIAKTVTIGKRSKNYGSITATTVTIAAGGTNMGAGTITAQNVTVAANGNNIGPITVTGVVTVAGTNAGNVTGSVVLNNGGTNTAQATITGNLTINGGNSAAAVTGDVRLAGGANTGAVSGNLYVLSAAASNVASVGGNIIVATTVANLGPVLPSGYTGSVIQVVQGALTTTTYNQGGIVGSPSTTAGTYYNLEGDSKVYTYDGADRTAVEGLFYNLQGDSKAYTYTGGQGAAFTGPAYNLTSDSKAYNWNNGVKGSLYTGGIGSDNYIAGVLQASTSVSYNVSGDVTTLYTASGGSVTTGPVYTDSGLTMVFTGVFSYGGATYYSDSGTPNTYRGWTVTNSAMFNNILFTAPGESSVASAAAIYSASILTVNNLYTGIFTEGGQDYYAKDGVAQTYIEYAVIGDSNEANPGYLYSHPIFAGTAGQYLYKENALTNKYTGYYEYLNTSYYTLDGELVSYRAWTVSGDTNNGTVYSYVKASLVVQDAVFSNSSLNIPYEGIFYLGNAGTQGYTKVLMSFDHSNGYRISSITPIDHEYTTGGYYHDNANLAANDYVYTGQYTDVLTTDLVFYSGTENSPGYTRISLDGSGLVSSIAEVNHSLNVVDSSSNTFYYDNELVEGTVLYIGQYTDTVPAGGNYGTFTVGTNGTQGYGIGSVAAGGSVSVAYVNRGQSMSVGGTTYYYDNATPTTGEGMYVGQYSSTTTTDSFTFYIGTDGTQGYLSVSVAGGAMTVTPIDHQYSITASVGTLYFDNSSLAAGDFIYSNRYSIQPYTTGFTAYTGIEGMQGYARITQADTAGTVAITLVDHQYSFDIGSSTYAYFNKASPESGDLAYSGRYTDGVLVSGSFYTGNVGTAGYTTYSISNAGVLTVTPVNHSTVVTYNSVSYYTDALSINTVATGNVFYTSQYDNAYVASGTVFTINEGVSIGVLVTIGSNGSATVESINHPNTYTYHTGSGSYTAYANVNTLTNGVVLYSSQYSMSPVADIPANSVGTEGVAGYGSYTTNGSGVVTFTPVSHTYEFIAGGIAADIALPTNAGSAITLQTYVNKYSNQPAAATTFRVGGFNYIIDSTGNLGTVESFSGYSAGELWVNGLQISGTFSAPAEYRPNCDTVGTFVKLTLSGPGNIGDLVYKTESRTAASDPFTVSVGAYSGPFSDGNTWWLAINGVIETPGANNCTEYAD